MKIHVLQHVPFEAPARIEIWARLKGADLDITRFYEPGWYLPAPDSMDLLVIMGGPMSVHEESAYPWLEVEKNFIRDCIAANRRIVGICLGAQLAAEALGAKVYPNAEKEIGWFPIHKTAAPHPLLWDVPQDCTVFHWHGDTFDLPERAVHLAYSDACVNQAFLWNEQVLGLQFHMELMPEHVEALLDYTTGGLEQNRPYIQTVHAILKGCEYTPDLNVLLDSVLNRFMN